MAVVTLISVSGKNAIDVTLRDLEVVIVASDQCEVVVDEDAAIGQRPTDESLLLPSVTLFCYVYCVLSDWKLSTISEIKDLWGTFS